MIININEELHLLNYIYTPDMLYMHHHNSILDILQNSSSSFSTDMSSASVPPSGHNKSHLSEETLPAYLLELTKREQTETHSLAVESFLLKYLHLPHADQTTINHYA